MSVDSRQLAAYGASYENPSLELSYFPDGACCIYVCGFTLDYSSAHWLVEHAHAVPYRRGDFAFGDREYRCCICVVQDADAA